MCGSHLTQIDQYLSITGLSINWDSMNVNRLQLVHIIYDLPAQKHNIYILVTRHNIYILVTH